MGFGSGKGSTTVQMSPAQEKLLGAQTDALTGTFLPAYKKTLGMADTAYEQANPAAIAAANTAMGVSGRAGALQESTGSQGLTTGMAGLASLFDPKYEEGQVQAALQAGRESGRDLVNQQVAGYGAAGGLGSSRAALASANLAGLQEQRQATAAASARAGVQANKAAAANQLATLGQSQLGAAQTSAAARIGYAQTPQDVLAKYASVIYGTPQASTTPNFAGTQGQRTSSKGFGF
tara:strand:- start:3696 stop:4400 length:705 start_codon:yes stop_codon:yes gene_type:complete